MARYAQNYDHACHLSAFHCGANGVGLRMKVALRHTKNRSMLATVRSTIRRGRKRRHCHSARVDSLWPARYASVYGSMCAALFHLLGDPLVRLLCARTSSPFQTNLYHHRFEFFCSKTHNRCLAYMARFFRMYKILYT